jgi:outer membrane lipoprotein-sorting protein
MTKRGSLIAGILFALNAALLVAQTTPAPTKPATKSKASTSKTTKAPAKAPAVAPAKAEEPVKASAPDNSNLEAVLEQLDKASAEFKSTEADFIWEQYQKVVDETDTQKGKIFFVRDKTNTNMAATVTDPDRKELTFSEGKLRFYQPRIDQVTEYDAGKNKGEVETFLVLGFGGRGHDLPKSFGVKFAGYETIDGVKTAKLELDPKTPKVKSTFDQIILWVDPVRGVSVKQQFIEPSGDYRVAKYSNFKMNGKVGEEVFKLKTTSKTKVVRQS